MGVSPEQQAVHTELCPLGPAHTTTLQESLKQFYCLGWGAVGELKACVFLRIS